MENAVFETVNAPVVVLDTLGRMQPRCTGDAVLLQSSSDLLGAGYSHGLDDLRLGHGAWAAVPLKTNAGVIGVLGVAFAGARAFAEDERALLFALAAQCVQGFAGLHLVREPAGNPPALSLSGREREVLNLLAAGLTNREIADLLALSIDTIKTHVDHIGDKLGVAGSSRSRVLTAVRATLLGLVSASPTPGTITHVGDAGWQTLRTQSPTWAMVGPGQSRHDGAWSHAPTRVP